MTLEEFKKRGGENEEWAPGWEAVEGVFSELYPEQEPYHLATNLVSRASLGGDEYLDGYSIYKSENGYFHMVSFGMTWLYFDETKFGGNWNGWGYEMTMKLKADNAEDCRWVCSLMGNLAKYTNQTKSYFDPYEYVYNGKNTSSICPDKPDSKLVALLIVPDSEAETIDTVYGKTQFLQLVGITKEEIEFVLEEKGNAKILAKIIKENNPHFVTDLDRESYPLPEIKKLTNEEQLEILEQFKSDEELKHIASKLMFLNVRDEYIDYAKYDEENECGADGVVFADNGYTGVYVLLGDGTVAYIDREEGDSLRCAKNLREALELLLNTANNFLNYVNIPSEAKNWKAAEAEGREWFADNFGEEFGGRSYDELQKIVAEKTGLELYEDVGEDVISKLFDAVKMKSKKSGSEAETVALSYESFEAWLDERLQNGLPESLVGVGFNIYEEENHCWAVELAVTKTFDPDDGDWVCDAALTFSDRYVWQQEVDWEAVHNTIVSLVWQYLENNENAALLKRYKGVGVGFVDGNLEIVYQNPD